MENLWPFGKRKSKQQSGQRIQKQNLDKTFVDQQARNIMQENKINDIVN